MLRRILPASMGVLLSLAAAVAAQDTPSPTNQTPDKRINANRLRPEGPRQRGLRPRKRFTGRGQRLAVGQLNLTDEQRQQRRAILQRHLVATKTQREQLFQLRQKRIEGSFTAEDQARAQSIRQELRASMQGIRGEMLGTLTADQRSRIETFREQRKQRREEMMKRREEFRRTRPRT